MSNDPTVWGVHMGHHVSDRPVEGGYVAIGWPAMGDLGKIAPNREAFKDALALAYPDKKKGAIPVDAGSMFKFLHEIKAGDFVVYPSKADRMVNIGRFKGVAQHHEGDPDEYRSNRYLFPTCTKSNGTLSKSKWRSNWGTSNPAIRASI